MGAEKAAKLMPESPREVYNDGCNETDSRSRRRRRETTPTAGVSPPERLPASTTREKDNDSGKS